MSYVEIAQLTDDAVFQSRVRACTVQEAQTFKDDARPAWVALANDCLRGGGATTLMFVRLMAAFPGFVTDLPAGGLPDAPSPAPGPPRFDQSRIQDAAILAQVQAQWGEVADLFFDDDGDLR
jgi:hypothetical protein